MAKDIENRSVLKVVSVRDVAARLDRAIPDHGFFNARNSRLAEIPVRTWGRADDSVSRRGIGSKIGKSHHRPDFGA